jgi:hypothetical protein
LTPRTAYLATAFVWTCAIMAVALIIAFLPFIKATIWWVFE